MLTRVDWNSTAYSAACKVPHSRLARMRPRLYYCILFNALSTIGR
jgi:hypothetical protein